MSAMAWAIVALAVAAFGLGMFSLGYGLALRSMSASGPTT